MAKKSSFLLAILFVANPVMLLLFQNCSVMPASSGIVPAQAERLVPAPEKASSTSISEKAL